MRIFKGLVVALSNEVQESYLHNIGSHYVIMEKQIVITLLQTWN